MDQKIKDIITRFNEQEDLKHNVLEFFCVSLLKLQQLLDKQTTLEQFLNIEINHLVEKEIHKVLDAYLQIPIDIRNTVIRDNKTGKQLLVEQLAALNVKIEDIWQKSVNTQRIVVMHRKITEGTEINAELAPEKYTLDIEAEAREFVQSFESFDNFKKREESTDKGLTPLKFLSVAVLLILFLLILAATFN